jgi:hypothetical protein
LKTPWVIPAGPEAYPNLKQAHGVFGHKLNVVWDDDVGPKVLNVLDSQKVDWTSIDLARFTTEGDRGKKTEGPVVIWVGVCPASLQAEDAFISGNMILEVLVSFQINDVEVEYRESIYRRSAGPALLHPASEIDATLDFCGPFTPALGLSIAPSNRPYTQGTMGLYFAEGGGSNTVLGLTCRHVLFEMDTQTNSNYELVTGAPRTNVQPLGTDAFENLLESIKTRIRNLADSVIRCTWQIEQLEEREGGGDVEDAEAVRKQVGKLQAFVDARNKQIEDLKKFHTKVTNEWGSPEHRTIGHIRSSPAIAFNVGPEGFTEDWGAIELDGPKFRRAFKGNALDLGVFGFISLQVIQSDIDMQAQRLTLTHLHQRCIPALMAKLPSSTPIIVSFRSATCLPRSL